MACVFLASIVVVGWSSARLSKVSGSLQTLMERNDHDSTVDVWIFFNRKSSIKQMDSFLSDKALKRRAIHGVGTDLLDVPVDEALVFKCEEAGLKSRHTSKWLNAVSGSIKLSDLKAILKYEFVSYVQPVGRHKVPRPISEYQRLTRGSSDPDVYGESFGQLDLISVPEVHEMGFYGQGVTIAVFDNGFRLLGHEAFESLNIVATKDFVDHKEDVVPVNPSPAFGSHGVFTLAVLGGYAPGRLVGPAIKSDFILARTENDSGETSVEEDNWVAALEWAEGLGADIVSSSVSYLEMDAGSLRSYDWTWMNGDSTVITKAANLAVSRGMIIVNSAGNEGFNSSHNTLSAPADGDSVIATGAIDVTGARAWFSSVGPTTKGRIKPDVMASGVRILSASSTNEKEYVFVDGTSFACPLTAGVCALILSAHPGLSSSEVRYALLQTSSTALSPDNTTGYGTINAKSAVTYFGLTGSPLPKFPPVRFKLLQNFPNPFNSATTIKYDQAIEGRIRLTIFNVLGQKVRRLVDRIQPVGRYEAVWDAKSDRGETVASGLYFYKLDGPGFSSTKKLIHLK